MAYVRRTLINLSPDVLGIWRRLGLSFLSSLLFPSFTDGFWRLFQSQTWKILFKSCYSVATSTSEMVLFYFFLVPQTCLAGERDGGGQGLGAEAGTTAYCCLILLTDQGRFSVTCRNSVSGILAPLSMEVGVETVVDCLTLVQPALSRSSRWPDSDSIPKTLSIGDSAAV